MIDIKDLIKNPDFYKQSSKNKNLDLDNLIDDLCEKYKLYLQKVTEEQTLREKLNENTKLISQQKKVDSSNPLLEASKILSQTIKTYNEDIKVLKDQVFTNILHIPNPALEIVPLGKDESFNVIIKSFYDELKKPIAKPHWEILEAKNLALFKEAAFLSGSRNVIYKNKGALLVKAIEQYMLETHTNNNYELFDAPLIVNEEILINTAQLPKMEEDLYKLTNNQYLIPTAETTLTNLVANQIIDHSLLPLKFVASSACFRKEAGSGGRDTRGIIRLHQFRKVELVRIVNPNNSLSELEQTLNDAASILEGLKIPYRILQLASGDISFGSQITYDLEVWMPSSQVYREISSVSLMGDFQARRMKARLKDENNNKQFVHTINGSGLAIDRTLAAILENYQTSSGDVEIPRVLQKYLRFNII